MFVTAAQAVCLFAAMMVTTDRKKWSCDSLLAPQQAQAPKESAHPGGCPPALVAADL